MFILNRKATLSKPKGGASGLITGRPPEQDIPLKVNHLPRAIINEGTIAIFGDLAYISLPERNACR